MLLATKGVTIRLSSKQVGTYEARSYPQDSYSNSKVIELYKVPLYEVTVSGTDAAGTATSFTHAAPRFMPFWNDPKNPSSHYHAKGWVNAGLSSGRTITVATYLPHYAVQNRYSPGRGALVLKGAFDIHAGPGTVADFGFGSAGCVEIIGNYDDFKSEIASLSGSHAHSPSAAIEELVKDHRLTVVIEDAHAPDIRSAYSRSVSRKTLFP